MSAAVLRTEVRRSSAFWAGVLVPALALGLIYGMYSKGPWWKDPVRWTEQWVPMAIWGRFLLVFLWPLAAGLGAALGMRDARSGMTELIATTARPARRRAVVTAGALALMLSAGYLLVAAVSAVQIASTGTYLTFGWVPITLVGIGGLVAGGLLGMGLGRALPSPLTPALLSSGSLVVVIALWSSTATGSVGDGFLPGRIALLSPTLAAPADPWHTVAGRVTAGQALWMTGLAVAGFLLVAAKDRAARLLAAVPAAAGLVAALALFPAHAALVPDAGAAKLVCQGAVCVTKVHEGKLAVLAGPARDALRQLRVLPGAPVRVEETPTVHQTESAPPRSASAILVDFGDFEFWHLEGDALRRALLAGAGTPTCLDELRATDANLIPEFAARTVAASWFDGQLRPLRGYRFAAAEVAAKAQRAWDGLQRLPRSEQAARIAAVRQAGLTCQGDEYAILTSGTGIAR
ncbi:MAG: hypothetical protein QOD41_2133 [Cryptosporangiaceae bacterium]|nr:hypothetical protein [Cryptosporangiaceae bacterium]